MGNKTETLEPEEVEYGDRPDMDGTDHTDTPDELVTVKEDNE